MATPDELPDTTNTTEFCDHARQAGLEQTEALENLFKSVFLINLGGIRNFPQLGTLVGSMFDTSTTLGQMQAAGYTAQLMVRIHNLA